MKQEKNIYFPLFASEMLNGGFQSDSESTEVWEKLTSLPPNKMNVVLSTNLPNAIARLDEDFGIQETDVEAVTVLTRKLFLGEISRTTFWENIAQLVPRNPQMTINADELQQYIQKEILECVPDVYLSEEEVQAQSEWKESLSQAKQLPLLRALSMYPSINSQLISDEPLKLKYQREPAKGTVGNWLKVYRDELGIGKHSSVDRGNFLYRSANTRNLSDAERERVHVLIRSLEDEDPVAVDPETRNIIFGNLEKKEEEQLHSTIVNSDTVETSGQNSPQDLFERFQTGRLSQVDQDSSHRAFSQGGIHKNQARITLSQDLPSVGTGGFGAPTQVKNNTRAEEEKILEKIQHIPDFNQASNEEEVPLGKVAFTTNHVLPREAALKNDTQQLGSQSVSNNQQASEFIQYKPTPEEQLAHQRSERQHLEAVMQEMQKNEDAFGAMYAPVPHQKTQFSEESSKSVTNEEQQAPSNTSVQSPTATAPVVETNPANAIPNKKQSTQESPQQPVPAYSIFHIKPSQKNE